MPARCPIRTSLVLRSNGHRVAHVIPRKRQPVYTGAQVYQYLWNDYARHSPVERLWIIPIDAHGWALYDRPVEASVGGVSSVLVSIPDIMAIPLLAGAPGLIAVHNHPGGDAAPSQADYTTARRLRKAAATLDLVLYDDIIVTQDAYFSFREETHVLRRRRRPARG